MTLESFSSSPRRGSRRLSAPLLPPVRPSFLLKRPSFRRNRTSSPSKAIRNAADAAVSIEPLDTPYSKLAYALCAGRVSASQIEKLIEESPTAVCEADVDGLFPLHAACRNPRMSREVVEVLIEHGRDVLNARTVDGQTPLHLAVEHVDNLDVILSLVAAFPGALSVQDSDGRLPIHMCLYGDSISVDVGIILAKRFKKGLEKVDKYSCLPLHLALMEGAHLDLIKLWTKAFPRALHKKDNHGRLPLHLALCFRFPHDIIRFFVEAYSGASHVADKEGKLPLHVAICTNAPKQTLRLLLEHTPLASLKAVDDRGRTPFHCILGRGGTDVVLQTVELMVDSVPGILAHPIGRHHRLPLHIAGEMHASAEVLAYLIRYHEPALRTRDKTGKLPLHCAVETKGVPAESLTTLFNAAPEMAVVADKRGLTPIKLAYKNDVPIDIIYPMAQRCQDPARN